MERSNKNLREMLIEQDDLKKSSSDKLNDVLLTLNFLKANETGCKAVKKL